MSDSPMHSGSSLQDLLDDRLDPTQRAEVEAHVAQCLACRRELAALRWVREVALGQLPTSPLPVDLPQRIVTALDAADHEAAVGSAARPTTWKRRAYLGAALAAAALLLLLLRPRRARSVAVAAARDFADYQSGRLQLEHRSGDPASIEAFFRTRGIRFPTRVFDLGMMEYQLVGGLVTRLGGSASALFAYRGPAGVDLLCQMYEGRLTELPPPDEVRENRRIPFQIYRLGATTLVFWQEGAVVCVLVSDGDPEAVVQLAFAKADIAG